MNDFPVALCHEICTACGAKLDEHIVLPRVLTKQVADAVRDMHGKATGFGWCAECKAVVDGGGVFLIEIDPAKSPTPIALATAWRTGRVAAIKREAYDRIFNVAAPHGVALIDPEASERLGLFAHLAN